MPFLFHLLVAVVSTFYKLSLYTGRQIILVVAPALWNVSPREIRSITDLGIFKCHLKTHFFKEAFY